jgi:hypothetical protein
LNPPPIAQVELLGSRSLTKEPTSPRTQLRQHLSRFSFLTQCNIYIFIYKDIYCLLINYFRFVRLQTDLPFVSSLKNRQTTNFRWHDEQTVNRLRKIALDSVLLFSFDAYISSCFHVSLSVSPCLHFSMSMSPHFRNSANGKRQLSFVFCKQKTETANFRLFVANRNRKRTFVFLGWQTINGLWRIATYDSTQITMNGWSLTSVVDNTFSW